jgi:hypothetical protein
MTEFDTHQGASTISRKALEQNMAVSSAGLRPKSDCFGKAQKQLYSYK